MLALTVLTAILAALATWAGIHYGRRALAEARNANALASERSFVEWQIDRRHDDKPGRFYAINVGHDTAYEVTLWAWDGQDRVEIKADAVAPFGEGSSTEDGETDMLQIWLVTRERTARCLRACHNHSSRQAQRKARCGSCSRTR